MKIFIFILSCIFFLSAKSQTPPTAQITGKVVDSVSKTPISYATIALKNDKKAIIKTVVSSPNGSFTITGLSTGDYLLSIVYVGYQTKNLSLKLIAGNKDLGVISLGASASQLKSVSITADRPLIKQEIDRISYDVKADPESKVTNVLEMMRKVPMLSVDGDENIQLQGNSNYKILINGRPSGMMERNPKDILKSMPASSIEKIEVITTPPAKYDGEGLAGIINIITFKKADNGTNGTVNISERFPVGGLGAGGSFTLKSGKFGLSTNAGASQNNSPMLLNSNSRITAGSNATNLWQTGTRDASGKSGYAGVELSLELDSLNLISGQFNYNANDNEGINTQISALSNSAALLQSYELLNNRDADGSGVDAAVNYQLGFKKDKNRLLTFSYRYYSFENTQFNNVDVFNALAYNLPDYRQDNTGKSAEQTVQVDYVHPIKKLTIEMGIKAIFRDNASNFLVETMNTAGTFVTDPLRTNSFDNQQNVYGVYNTYQFNLNNWGFKAGVRVEQTEIDANFLGTNTTLNNSSLNVIPSISINRKFKNNSSLNLGFTSRIQRPGINQLNPFVDRSNPNFESSGNPALRPTTGNSFELNYSSFKKVSFNVGLRGMFFTDLIMPQIITDQATNITRSSFANTGDATLIGLGVNVSYPFSKKLKLSANGMASYGRVTGEVNGASISNDGIMSRGYATLSYRMEKGWQANGSFNYNGPNLSLQGTTNPFYGSSFNVSKELFKSKLTISFAANNVFSKYREALNFTSGPNFTQEAYTQNYQRNFTTSLNYRFGRLKESIKKNKKGISNNDVSDGGI